MKKRVRVYKRKEQMKEGGPVTNNTQDSKLDNIPEQRASKFSSWLQNSAMMGAEREKQKQYEEFLKSMSKGGNTSAIPGYSGGGSMLSPGASLEDTTKNDTHLAYFQQQYMKDQESKNEFANNLGNLGAYAVSTASMPDVYTMKGGPQNPFGESVDMTGMEITGYGPGKDKRHRTLSYEATGTPSTQPPSVMSESQAWDNPNMSDEDWENYMNDKAEIKDSKLRNAWDRLKYAQDGGTPYYSPVETGEGLLNEDNFVKTKQKRNGRIKQKEITEKRFDRIQNRYDRRGGYAGEDNDTTVHRRGNKSVSDMNPDTTGPTKPNYYGEIYGGQGGYNNNVTPPQVGNNYYPNPVTPPTGDNPYYPNPTQNLIAPPTPDIETPNMTPPSFVRDGGFINLPRAQNGLDCPTGYEKDEQGNCVPVITSEAGMDYGTLVDPQPEGSDWWKPFPGAEAPPTLPSFSTAENPDLNSGMDQELTTEGVIDLTRQSKLKTIDQQNPYLKGEAITTGINALAYIGEQGDKNANEAKLRKRISNPFEVYRTAGADRGDYMANVPGFGNELKPDEHTRWGRDTKVAQDGMEVGDSMQVGQETEMSDEEIQRLLAQGYKLEFLD